MAEQQFIMTKKGYDEAVERLRYLQTVKRQEIVDRISEARSHGDLSENAEYDAARNEQAANEYYTVAAAMAFVCAVALFIAYYFFTEPLIELFGAEGNVLKLGVEYMRAMCFSVPTFTMCACLSTCPCAP